MLSHALRSAAGWTLRLVRQQARLIRDPLTLIGHPPADPAPVPAAARPQAARSYARKRGDTA
ncbi:hypothetical protein [Longispora albida]|uniref:hypothetical protein n=1 Tax=Longispora albida TaxID=203523 RepID=UPI0003A65AE0|nr:hypothetical protein [Longispora albida]